MAAMADALAFSAYGQQSALYTAHTSTTPGHHDIKNGDKTAQDPRDRDSGVFLSDAEDPLPPSRQPSVSLKHTPSVKFATTPQRSDSTNTDRRLRRPAELNLGQTGASDAPKPKSELELRYDMIRNSQTQSRAALKSPTQLMKDRLNLSPKKTTHEEKIRIFTPPRPMLSGCILPGPEKQMEAFTGRDVRAKTEEGRPAWWCKFDKLVVFDGAEGNGQSEARYKTRTSKGLSIARRRGDTETVIIPMNCAHCQDMLHRTEWRYDVQVCKRSVCWDCKERCRWESEQEREAETEIATVGQGEQIMMDGSRERADSVLQDQQIQEEELARKVGIEMPPNSPIEAVGGIEERLKE